MKAINPSVLLLWFSEALWIYNGRILSRNDLMRCILKISLRRLGMALLLLGYALETSPFQDLYRCRTPP